MMCDPTTRSFRSQLSAVLERLTKAALQEIASLADECSSVLHTEISLHRTENEALKKRCYSLEVQLRAAREAHAFPPGHLGGATGGRRHTMATAETLKDADQQPQLHPPPPPPPPQQVAPAIDGVFGKDWCLDLWREDKRGPAHRKDAMELPAMSNMVAGQVLDLMDREPDLIFVKEEAYDDHPIGQQMSLTDGQKGVAMFEEGMLHRSISDLQLHHSEELSGFAAVEGHQLRAQQPPPSIMDKLIDDAATAMSGLVDNAAPHPPHAAAAAAASGSQSEYPDYAHASPPARSAKAGKQFACLFCGKVFNYLSSLKVHIRRHSGEKPFSCAVCGKRFAQKTYLKLHQRVHSGEKPYSCPDCGKSFSQKSSLNIHLRTHTGEKPYSCVDCGKCYAYKYGLNHHQCFT